MEDLELKHKGRCKDVAKAIFYKKKDFDKHDSGRERKVYEKYPKRSLDEELGEYDESPCL